MANRFGNEDGVRDAACELFAANKVEVHRYGKRAFVVVNKVWYEVKFSVPFDATVEQVRAAEKAAAKPVKAATVKAAAASVPTPKRVGGRKPASTGAHVVRVEPPTQGEA